MVKISFPATAIKKACDIILSGTCKRVDVSDDVKVYQCKNIIRIDVKIHDN